MRTLRRMYEHLQWANEQLLETMSIHGHDNTEALRLFRHVAIAELVWITRLNGQSSDRFVLWTDDTDLAEIEELLRGNIQLYAAYLDKLSEDKLDDKVSYTNQTGARFETSIRDILTHVALHGQYHRGQINRSIRQAGGEPAGQDFILFSRLMG